jgi:hypothetical protein
MGSNQLSPGVDAICSDITLCLNAFIKVFQNNPFEFLFESDIQARLYSILRERVRHEVALPVVYHKERMGSNTITTSIIKTEYPSKTKVGGKFDIAVIHPDSRKKLGEEEIGDGALNDAFWNQNLLGTIEIKYGQVGLELKRELGRLWRDVRKLQGYNSNPQAEFRIQFKLALLFIQFLNGSMHPTIADYFGTKHLKAEIVSEIGKLSDTECYIISKSEMYRVRILD